MSAFLCSDRHTAAVALLLSEFTGSLAPVADLLSALRKLNNQALAHRYGDAPTRLSSRARALNGGVKWVKHATPEDKLGVVRCFIYQCSEGGTMGGKLGQSLFALERALGMKARGDSTAWSI